MLVSQNMGFQQCVGMQNVWVLNFVGIENVWVFEFVGVQKSYGLLEFVNVCKQKLWMRKIRVLKNEFVSKICG